MKLIYQICVNILFISGISFADHWGFPRAAPMYLGNNNNNNRSNYYSTHLRRQAPPQNSDLQYSEPSSQRSPTFDQGYPPPLPIPNPPMPYPLPLPPGPHPNGLPAPSFDEISFYPLGPLPPPPPPPPPMFLEPMPYGYGSNSKPEYREDILFPLLLGTGIKTGIATVVGPLAILGIVGKLIGKGALGIGGAGLLGGVTGSSAISALSNTASLGKRRRKRSRGTVSAVEPELRFRYHERKIPLAVPSSTSRRLRAIEVASRYLSELGQDRAILDDLGLTYMGCAGLLDKNNHCLERLACELHSREGRKPEETSSTEKDVAYLILQSVFGNAKLDRTIKDRVRRAARMGQERRKMCFIFNCDHLINY